MTDNYGQPSQSQKTPLSLKPGEQWSLAFPPIPGWFSVTAPGGTVFRAEYVPGTSITFKAGDDGPFTIQVDLVGDRLPDGVIPS